MGRHRAQIRARRGVAHWPFPIMAVAALVLLGWLGWSWAESVMDRRAAAQANSCPQGDSTLGVAVAPSVAQPVAEAGRRWNDRRTIVHDHCVRVEVVPADSERVLSGLTAGWYEGPFGRQPQAWLPESSFWADRLGVATDNARISSMPESVASSPVVLAALEEAAKAVTAGNPITWTELPALTSAPDGWSRYARPEWGRFTVAMPAPATNLASNLAIQSALAGAGRQRPVTSHLLTQPPIQQGINQLAQSQPPGLPGSTHEALVRLGEADGMTAAPYGAVAVLEVDLNRRNLAADRQPAAKRPLFQVTPGDASPSADFPFVGLAGEGVDDVQIRAAQEFREFLLEPDQQHEFGRAGLRTAANRWHPADSPGMTWSTVPAGMEVADASTTQQISAVWSNAVAGGQVTTLLVDVSRSMIEDGGAGRSRMEWVREALHGYADYTTSGSLGLWEFATRLDGELPYRRLVPTGPIAERRPALHAGIDQLQPVGTTRLYTSVAALYQTARDGYVADRPNQIVIITDGGDDGDLTLERLRTTLHELDGPNRPIPINVIAVGPEPDLTELKELATATGGGVSVLADARGVPAALAHLAADRS